MNPTSSGQNAHGIWADDWIAVAIDHGARRFGSSFFLLSGAGASAAGFLTADGKPRIVDFYQWSGKLHREPTGYSAEFAIPLAQFPYKSVHNLRLGIRVIRFVRATGQEIDLPAASGPGQPTFRDFLVNSVVPSRHPSGEAWAQLQAEFNAKLQRIAQHGADTLPQRVAAFGDASVLDYRLFPSAPLHPSGSPVHYQRHLAPKDVELRLSRIEYSSGRRIGSVPEFLRDTQTTSLVVIKDDQIVYEKYFNGFGPASTFTSFSVAKSFLSTLVGIAIDRGLIRSEYDPVTLYVPELLHRDRRFAEIRISDLLHMASGLAYEEDGGARDDERTYMDPDLRKVALEDTRLLRKPATEWLYNNYNPLLIGLVLERSTHESVTHFTQEALWSPLGMQRSASWSLDSDASRFEKMESGLNANPIDFAKLGSLYLHDGQWKGRRVVSEAWVRRATQPRESDDQGKPRANGSHYGYYWWISPRKDGPSDFYALGNKGQYIYVSPAKRLVIVRTAIQYGLPSQSWPAIFRAFADTY